ncbi:hypothetical protein [Streptomyces sp. SID12488]|uniref:hypothetical protein n=1 Tax=Streptomyces sp. SID12488 TaxID=2706040 RepID=UPI0013DBF0F2|nr:hypothetical protein [Streptomyces sp. SID12488]NEA68180.1 hypothetical protein [Streptomyces sp. SID12488]
MSRTQARQVTATLVITVLMAALSAFGVIPATAGVTGKPGTTTVNALPAGPGPCCRIIGQDVFQG